MRWKEIKPIRRIFLDFQQTENVQFTELFPVHFPIFIISPHFVTCNHKNVEARISKKFSKCSPFDYWTLKKRSLKRFWERYQWFTSIRHHFQHFQLIEICTRWNVLLLPGKTQEYLITRYRGWAASAVKKYILGSFWALTIRWNYSTEKHKKNSFKKFQENREKWRKISRKKFPFQFLLFPPTTKQGWPWCWWWWCRVDVTRRWKVSLIAAQSNLRYLAVPIARRRNFRVFYFVFHLNSLSFFMTQAIKTRI